MIAIRTMFAAVMAVMIAGTVAQSSSSSSGVASLSSSSAIPVNPGFNGSSSSAEVWISSSSSTGADVPFYWPVGTYEVTYGVELDTSTIPSGLASALAKDFAATVASSDEYSITAEALYPFILVNVQQPASTFHTMQVGGVNVTAVAVVLGNVTSVVDINGAVVLASVFAEAARNGSVVTTESSVLGANVYPQEVRVEAAAQPGSNPDNTNGASAVSASLLIGSMVAALALAL